VNEQSLIDYMKKVNRISPLINNTTLIIVALSCICWWYIFNRYMVRVAVWGESSIVYTLVFIFLLIIFIARRLNRHIIYVESLIAEEVEPLLSSTNLTMPFWRSYKRQYRVIEAISSTLLILVPIAALLFPLSLLRTNLNEIFLFVLIVDICVTGLIRFMRFKNYMNALISLYQSIIQTTQKKAIIPDFMSYDFKPILIYATLSSFVFFIICHYLLLVKTNIVHVSLLAMAFFVLFILGKGLHLAISGFYESIDQIEIMRQEIIKSKKRRKRK